MKIGSIFRRDLSQRIKEVIKVDDHDVADVLDEISEYVVTDHIEEEFLQFLDVYQESIQKPSEVVNCWVSGFFGSGKSSFAKVLGYILSNPSLEGTDAAELFTSKLTSPRIEALLRTIHEQAPSMAVFVDISQSKNLQKEGESPALPLYRQLLDDLGYARDVTLAELEIQLEADGLLDDFEKAFEETQGFNWHERRDKALALNEASHALHVLDPETYPAADSYARTRPQVEFTANRFAKRAVELLRRRRPDLERIVFIVDEVGQYVSRDVDRMLDLQGLAQAIQKEDGKLWLAVTSQETLEDVVGALGDKRVELARVRDRFPIRVDLVPSDIEEVVSERVLAKTDEGASTVREAYESHENQLRTNVALRSPTRSVDFSKEEFVRVYPLLPYQIELFIDAVSARRAEGGAGPMVGGANRTLIRLAHQLLVSPDTNLGEQSVGSLATTPMAYDLMDDIVLTTVRGEIDRVRERHGQEAVELACVKAIALMSGVRGLPLDAENLACLLHPEIAAETLQPVAREAVDRLLEEEVIREGDDGFRIQSPEEKDWEKKRNSRELKSGEFRRLLRDKRLPDMLRALSASAGREFAIEVLFDDDKIVDGDVSLRLLEGGDDQLERAVRRSRESAHENDVFLVFSASDKTWRNAEETFRSSEMIKDVEARGRSGDANLLHEERKRLERHERDLDRSLSADLLDGRIVFRGEEQPIDGRDLRPTLSKAVAERIEAIYPRLKEFAAPVRRQDAVTVLTADDLSGVPDYLGDSDLGVVTVRPDGHAVRVDGGPVETLIEVIKQQVDYGNQASGQYLRDRLARPPFGAEQDVVMVVTAAAVRAGTLEVGHGGNWIRSPADARLPEVFSKVTAFRSAVFQPRSGDPEAEVRTRVAAVLQELYGERPAILTEELASFARRQLGPDREQIDATLGTLRGLELEPPETVLRAKELLERVRNDDDPGVVTALDAGRSDLKDGIRAARSLADLLGQDDAVSTLRQAQRTFTGPASDFSEAASEAHGRGVEILQGRSYVDRFPELRGALETVVEERRERWREAAEQLEGAISRARAEVDRLASKLPGGSREEFDHQLQGLELSGDASFETGPSSASLMVRASKTEEIVDDARAEASRPQGGEIVRARVSELFPDPVRSEEDLEVLLDRIRRAAEEAIAEGKTFFLR